MQRTEGGKDHHSLSFKYFYAIGLANHLKYHNQHLKQLAGVIKVNSGWPWNLTSERPPGLRVWIRLNLIFRVAGVQTSRDPSLIMIKVRIPYKVLLLMSYALALEPVSYGSIFIS